MEKIKVVTIGHSYVVAMNRAVMREISLDPDFDITVGAPDFFHGSLRKVKIEPEEISSRLRLVSLPCFLTQKMHIFFYNPMKLNKLLKEGSFDCAYFWEEPYILSGWQLAQRAHQVQLPFFFNTFQNLLKKYIPPFGWMENQTVDKASSYVAGGQLVLEAMNKKGWTLKGEFVPPAVDTSQFIPMSNDEKIKKRKQLGIAGPVIGFLGRLSEEKGCDIFMKSLERLKDLEWSLLVMGSGEYKSKIEEWAQKNNIQDRVKVIFLNHEEVPQFLPVCDLLICPSQTRKFWKEQFGRMLVEAFASGVPIIGSDSGEIPRVIDQAGVVLKEDDVSAWENELRHFILRPQDFESFKELGLKRAQKFSVESVAQSYKNIFIRLKENSSQLKLYNYF